MKFIVEIECDNEPFLANDESGEFDQSNSDAQVADLLNQIADALDKGAVYSRAEMTLRDRNGNTVGTARYERS